MAGYSDEDVKCLSGNMGYTFEDMGLDHQHNVNYFHHIQQNAKNAGLIPEDSSVDQLKLALKQKLQSDPVIDKVGGTKPKYKIADTRGDGNCFYRATSNVVSGSEENHAKFRELTVNEIRNNPARYKQAIELTHLKQDCPTKICSQTGPTHKGAVVKSLRSGTSLAYSTEEFIESISISKTYSTAPEVIALSNLLKTNIHTIVKAGNTVSFHPSFYDPELPSPTIVLYNSGEHFQPVISVQAFKGLNPSHFCYLCKEKLPQTNVKRHLQTRHPFMCPHPTCFLKFNNVMVLQDHENSQHNMSGFLEKTQHCDKCLDEFSKGSSFTRHLQMDHSESCPECALAFVSKNQLNQHIRRTHKHSTKPIGDEKVNEAEKKKKQLSPLRMHSQNYEKEKNRQRKKETKETKKERKEKRVQEANNSNKSFENERKIFGDILKDDSSEETQNSEQKKEESSGKEQSSDKELSSDKEEVNISDKEQVNISDKE